MPLPTAVESTDVLDDGAMVGTLTRGEREGAAQHG
jgi:hypothetical protein